MKSLALAAVAVLGGAYALATGVPGCAHPYSGKPEKLKVPKKKKPPKGEESVDEEPGESAAADESCRTNFFAEPHKGRRRAREARNMARATNPLLLKAERSEEEERRTLILDIMAKLKNALAKDPYAPQPTYKYAVAYALAGKKGCALAFLDRLKLLRQYPPVEKEASRTIQQALRDPAFEPFRKDADTALGE